MTNLRACLHAIWVSQAAYYMDYNIHAPDVDGEEREQTTGMKWIDLLSAQGVSCPGEFCTYRPLTTPIPYMSELCYDPFLGQYHEKAVKGIALPEYTSIFSRPNPINRIRNARKYGLTYIMFSQGPDQARNVHDFDGVWVSLGAGTHHRFQLPVFYSPTNGTRSDGDLVTSNRGHEPVR